MKKSCRDEAHEELIVPSGGLAATGIGEASVKKRPAEGAAPAPPPAGTKPQRDAREGARRRRESEELRVLQLLEQGKVSTQEAADLIAALQDARSTFDDE